MKEVRSQNAECRSGCNLQFAFCIFLFVGLSTTTIFAEDHKKIVIPFDFVSKFDDGRYGRIIGDMIWKKIDSEGGFILPESMQDVRDYCQSHHIQPSPDDSLDKMKKIVKDDFDGQIGIWGGVERAQGTEGEIYDLAIKCVDFSAEPEPKVIYECKSRTNSVSEIPHLYVKQMLDALYHRQPGGSNSADPAAEANWHKNSNLVAGGDFQSGANGVPNGWEPVAGQKREPLGSLVQWVAEEGKPENKVIRFTFDSSVGDNEGVMYYSDYFPVEEGAKYRFQCRWKTNGPAVKVFIKCYDQRREVYRSQQNLKGPKNTWNIQTEDFTPKHTKYSPNRGRVMLYAYLGGGTVEFDDVIVKQILPAPKAQNKELKQSLGTRVTVKEMEENDRRSRKAKELEQK